MTGVYPPAGRAPLAWEHDHATAAHRIRLRRPEHRRGGGGRHRPVRPPGHRHGRLLGPGGGDDPGAGRRGRARGRARPPPHGRGGGTPGGGGGRGGGTGPTGPPRRRTAAEENLGGVEGDVEIDELDLADLDSVRAFAERFLASERPVDVLIDNAAVMASPETRVGPGWEAQFATNHLGHFTLANLLWPALAADGGARVVALSSTGHKRSGIRWDDVMFEHDPYDKWAAYGQAKTADSLFAVQLDALGRDAGVRAFAVHPGGILTPLQRHLSREEMIGFGWIDEDGHIDERFKSPEQGASTATWAATSPRLAGMGGVYCEDTDIAA